MAILSAAAITVALAALLLARSIDRSADFAEQNLAPRGTTDGSDASDPRTDRTLDRAGGRDDGARRVVARRVARVPPSETAATAPRRVPTAGHDEGDEPARNRREIDAGEYIAALRASGETEGLAAFSPPGTRPVQSGIIVPDDYELPEGFVRHYQTTDDGRQLSPILTLSPDYELVDENGAAIPLPRDRIVPPELAPPDLPVRMLEVPSTPGREQGLR